MSNASSAGAVLTPNVRRLLIYRMSVLAVPSGGGLADGLSFFTDTDKRRGVMVDAEKWTRDAIAAVRNAGEPNPWNVATDEEIAAEILRRTEQK